VTRRIIRREQQTLLQWQGYRQLNILRCTEVMRRRLCSLGQRPSHRSRAEGAHESEVVHGLQRGRRRPASWWGPPEVRQLQRVEKVIVKGSNEGVPETLAVEAGVAEVL